MAGADAAAAHAESRGDGDAVDDAIGGSGGCSSESVKSMQALVTQCCATAGDVHTAGANGSETEAALDCEEEANAGDGSEHTAPRLSSTEEEDDDDETEEEEKEEEEEEEEAADGKRCRKSRSSARSRTSARLCCSLSSL